MKMTEKWKEKKAHKEEKKVKEKKPLKQRIKDSMNKKYLKNGSYSVIISAVFIVIVIVINMIVGALPTKYSEFDVSEQKLYSIGDQTKSFLKKLDKDVTIYQVVKSGSEDETISKLLEKYADLWDWNEIIRIWRNSIYEDKGIDFYDKFQKYIPASKLQNSALWNEMVEQQMNSLIRDIIS